MDIIINQIRVPNGYVAPRCIDFTAVTSWSSLCVESKYVIYRKCIEVCFEGLFLFSTQ